MRVKRYIKLFLYRLKDQKLNFLIPLIYIFAVSGLAFFSICDDSQYLPRGEIYKLLIVFTPLISLFWILPILCERTDEKWGEFFISCKTDTFWQVLMHNIVFDLLMLPGFCMFSFIYGNMINMYLQMVITNVFLQSVGIAALYLSSSAFTAYGIPFLYSCLTMFSLLDSEMDIALAFATYNEITMPEYLAAHWWKTMPVFLAAYCSILTSKR